MDASDIALDIFGARQPQICRYVDILTGPGIERGLIGPREAGRLWERHIFNSVAPAALIPADATVVDVGSGAGLPGIPLAVLRPDLRLTLLEPLLRRYAFLVEAVADLGLGDRVEVVRGRAEDQSQARFQVVTGRAVAPFDRLLGWTHGLLSPDGQLLALKGASATEEVAAASKTLRRFGLTAQVLPVQAHPLAEETVVIRATRRR